MPRVNPPAAAAIQGWIKDIPEIQYAGVGERVYCRACDVTFLCTQRAHISRHIAREKHKANIGLQTQSNFNRNLVEVMVACNIPWNQLNNPIFRQFLHNCTSGKFSNMSVPSEFDLGKYDLPAERNHVKETLLMKIGNNNIWISVDETTDAYGRTLAFVAVGALDETTPTQTHIIACKQLERTNAETVTLLIDSCLKELWADKYEENVGKLLLFITDAAPYMKRAGKLLKEKYENMLHLTCLAHALNRVAEAVRALFPKVNQLISNMKQVFVRAPHRINVFRQMLPHIPLPPEPVITTWGTWLKAASYYYCYFNDIKRVIEKLDDDEAQSIAKVKQSYSDPNMINDLSYIHAYFSSIPLAIKRLEKSTLSAIEAMNVIFDLRHYLFQLTGEVAEEIKTRFNAVLNTNPGFHTMCCVVDLLNGKEVDFSSPELNVASLRHYTYFKHAPVTSVDVEQTFSRIKWILTDRCRKLTIEHLESLLIIYCEAECGDRDYHDE